jgi:hypothetical protein
MTSSNSYHNSTINNYNYNCIFGDNSSYSTTSSSNPSPINDNQSIPVARESSFDRNSNITPTFDNVPLPVAHVSQIDTISRSSAK